MNVREADSSEFSAVMNIIDGAALAADADTVRERIESGDVLVAVESDRVLGVLVLDRQHVDAVAVRRRRRSQGIGTALVEAAAARTDRLTADFAPNVKPFYEKLGFEITADNDRYHGTLR